MQQAAAHTQRVRCRRGVAAQLSAVALLGPPRPHTAACLCSDCCSTLTTRLWRPSWLSCMSSAWACPVRKEAGDTVPFKYGLGILKVRTRHHRVSMP